MTEPARPALAVCVFCASASGISGAHLDLAAEVGTELARRGHVLISGGGLAAAMGAVARAAHDPCARLDRPFPLAARALSTHDRRNRATRTRAADLARPAPPAHP